MEHFIRIALWITLIFCQQTNSAPIADFRIKMMKTTVTCDEGSRFYAPTNVKTHCITDALDCMRRELRTAQVECEDNGYMVEAVDSLDDLIKERSDNNLGLTNSTKCACEGYERKPFVEFVNALESLLQRVYSLWSWNAKTTCCDLIWSTIGSEAEGLFVIISEYLKDVQYVVKQHLHEWSPVYLFLEMRWLWTLLWNIYIYSHIIAIWRNGYAYCFTFTTNNLYIS